MANKFIFPIPPIPLRAAFILGIPAAANGNSNGLVFGSKLPIDRPDSNEEGFIAPNPAAVANEENGNEEANDVDSEEERLFMDDEPPCETGGLAKIGGRPGPFLRSIVGNRFCNSCGRFPLSLTRSAHFGSTSY